MYPSTMPNFTKKSICSFSSKQVDLNNSLTHEEIINQIKKEINPHYTNLITGFWWEDNIQNLNYWFTKIRLTWHTQLSDFQETHTYINNLFVSEEIDLSFQYGLMGFLLWLERENQKIQDCVIKDFIEITIKFLLSKKMKLNANLQQFSFFPEAFDKDTWTSDNSLSWKVGDLHFVKLLHRQSKGNFKNNYQEIAENIGLHSTTRASVEQTQITDSSLANGSTGLVVLYKALYYETGEEEYLKSSCYWFKRTEFFLESELKNGYYTGREANILDGLAGISIVWQELQKEGLSPLLAYLAG
jgi:hypothetical protein